MSEDTWKLQASYKFGQHGQNMLNVRGNSTQELEYHATQLLQTEATQTLGALGALLTAVETVEAVPTPVNAQGGPGYVSPMPTPVPVQHAPGHQQQAAPTPPNCPHGPRKYAKGVNAKGPWQAWFCALDRGTPGACDPQWIGK